MSASQMWVSEQLEGMALWPEVGAPCQVPSALVLMTEVAPSSPLEAGGL